MKEKDKWKPKEEFTGHHPTQA